jgi:hypothetical protein
MESQSIVDGLLGLAGGLMLGFLFWWFSYRSQRARWRALMALPPDAAGQRHLPPEWAEDGSHARLITPPPWVVGLCGRPCGPKYLWSPSHLGQLLGFFIAGLGLAAGILAPYRGSGFLLIFLLVFVVFRVADSRERAAIRRDPPTVIGPL